MNQCAQSLFTKGLEFSEVKDCKTAQCLHDKGMVRYGFYYRTNDGYVIQKFIDYTNTCRSDPLVIKAKYKGANDKDITDFYIDANFDSLEIADNAIKGN
ncbi:MAG: hypothetical protein FJX71_04240 [Alphaproteobacteria bacterium]|nr:hypothetical protein [Alphaproteobacteria bacterium]